MLLLLLLALVQVIGAQQLEGADLLPDCAKQCVYNRLPLSPELSRCNGKLSCLCGSNAKPYQDVLWSCIDDPAFCPSETHGKAINAVMTVCDSVLPKASTGANSSSAMTVTALSTATATATATTPAGKDNNTSGNGGDSELSAGAIAGIVVGALVFLSLLIGIPFLAIILRNRKRRRDEIRSMVLEPPSAGQPGREWKSGGNGDGNGYSAAWTSINSNDASPTSGSHFYHSKSQLTPIVTDIAPVENTGSDEHHFPFSSVSPVSPVSPIDDPAGGASVKSVVVGSRRIIENPQLEVDLAPAFNVTPSMPMATTRVAQGEIMSPVSPLTDFANAQLANTNSPSTSYRGTLPGQAFTTEFRSASPPTLEDASGVRHTCSAVTMPRGERVNTPDSHGSPVGGAPVISSETAESKRSSQSSSTRGATTAAGGAMARTDSVAWRKELEEAAGRAMTRVVQSEQSIHEESIAERRRKGSIPGLELFARRPSRDIRGDEESNLVSGETGSSFWSRKSDRVSTAPKSPGFFNPGRRRNSGATEVGHPA